MIRDERPVVADRCRELRAGVRDLLSAITRLKPADLSSRWWAGDPEANPALGAVAESLDECLARFDGLQEALGLPAGREPRYRRSLGHLRRGGRSERSAAPEMALSWDDLFDEDGDPIATERVVRSKGLKVESLIDAGFGEASLRKWQVTGGK